MRIAVIGSGISSLTAAYYLSRQHEVHVYEKDSRIGGHTATIEVDAGGKPLAVDTGFIVFNDWTYPGFIRLLNELGVASQPTTMSFSVKCEQSGLEYNGTSVNSLFAQRRNLLRPSFYKMIRDILRFNRLATGLMKYHPDSPDLELPLDEFLTKHRLGELFREKYIVPMGAAIWSASREQMRVFPVRFFIQFFKNHGMLSVDQRPTWRVIQGGSKSYLPKITAPFQKRIHLNTSIRTITRIENAVRIEFSDRSAETFDHVVLGCHSNQALGLLGDATQTENEILSAMNYQKNDVCLHTDISVLPKRKLAWAAWNYLVPKAQQSTVAVTYQMNHLQGFSQEQTQGTQFLVSLNMNDRIRPDQVRMKLVYDHPIFTQAAVQSQARWKEISNPETRTHYCGAYWSYGFHEDGVQSGMRVARSLGIEIPE